MRGTRGCDRRQRVCRAWRQGASEVTVDEGRAGWSQRAVVASRIGQPSQRAQSPGRVPLDHVATAPSPARRCHRFPSSRWRAPGQPPPSSAPLTPSARVCQWPFRLWRGVSPWAGAPDPLSGLATEVRGQRGASASASAAASHVTGQAGRPDAVISACHANTAQHGPTPRVGCRESVPSWGGAFKGVSRAPSGRRLAV